MKKKHLRTIRRMFAGVAILTSMVSVRAQVSNPSVWSDFVKGSGNTLITDTFRTQYFEKSPAGNWKYVSGEGVEIPEGKKTLRIPMGKSVTFEPFPIGIYQNVKIRISHAGNHLMPTETLLVRYLEGGTKKSKVLFSPQKNDDYFVYRTLQIDQSPSSLEIVASDPSAKTMDGYYLVDSVYAIGQIPRYSYFSGEGNWNDTARWSHLPPARYRNALIKGDLTVSTAVNCQGLSLGTGMLIVAEEGHLAVDDLLLFSPEDLQNTSDEAGSSLIAKGELTVKNKLSVCYTFPEKGKWYFISFPFDVYPEGIDSRFRLEDSRFSGSGNCFYLQTYNGSKRAETGLATGNWEVVDSDPLPSDRPLLQKNKGYLIALDEGATDNMLQFSANAGQIPEGFGKKGDIPVRVSSYSGKPGSSHFGWTLCGNPLPAPLSLSSIEPDPALDGNIYLYDGTTYKSYPIGSDYTLPPYAAFFVKASSDTDLHIINEGVAVDAVFLKAGSSLRSIPTEPQNQATAIASSDIGKSYLSGNRLHLESMAVEGTARAFDLTGCCRLIRMIPAGSSVLPLSLRPGLYILNITSGSYRAQHKCVITQ